MDAVTHCMNLGGDREAATLLKCRIALRAYDPAVVLEEMFDAPRTYKSEANRVEAAILLAASFARVGDFDSAASLFNTVRTASVPEHLRWEAAHQEALALWMAGKTDEAEDRLLAHSPREDDRMARARFADLRSWIAARRGNVMDQVRLLLQSVDLLTKPDYIDVGVVALDLRTLATLNRELHVPGLNEKLVVLEAELPWTEDLRVERFWVKSMLAWSLCLRGLWFPAIRLAQQATALAEGTAWRVQSLLDRANLKRNAGDLASGQVDLEEALDLIDTVNWASSRDEERLSLAIAAELCANSDPVRAHSLLMECRRHAGTFDVRMGAGRDKRLGAFLNQAAGAVYAAIGDKPASIKAYKEAYAVFKDVDHHWRAALAALNLFRLTGEKLWHEHAEEHIADYPDSWIASDVRLAAPLANLRPREKEVFQAMIEGQDAKMISQRLGVQLNTVRVHRQRVLHAFSVSSQVELMRMMRARRS